VKTLVPLISILISNVVFADSNKLTYGECKPVSGTLALYTGDVLLVDANGIRHNLLDGSHIVQINLYAQHAAEAAADYLIKDVLNLKQRELVTLNLRVITGLGDALENMPGYGNSYAINCDPVLITPLPPPYAPPAEATWKK
jgi:hypothetical protein